MRVLVAVSAAAVLCLALAGSTARAGAFRDDCAELVNSHNLAKAADADVRAAYERLSSQLGQWFPKVTGAWRGARNGSGRTNEAGNEWYGSAEFEAQLTQLIYDGGKTGAQIRAARLRHQSAIAAHRATQQDLLLAAVVAAMDVAARKRVLEYAQASEESIRRQQAAEESRVRIGQGFATDVVQAKAQVAGAQARTARAAGDLQVAKNAYRALFGRDLAKLNQIDVPLRPGCLPTSLEQAIKVALEQNPRHQTSTLSTKIAREEVSILRGKELGPTVQATLSELKGDDVGGRRGYEDEMTGMIEVVVPFDIASQGKQAVNGAKLDERSARFRHGEVSTRVEERVRNEWQNYETARQNAEHLRAQAVLARQFLDLAQKDRQLGRRSLLDVLTAETLVVSAESNAAQAVAEEVKAAYGLVHAQGLLSLDAIGPAPATK